MDENETTTPRDPDADALEALALEFAERLGEVGGGILDKRNKLAAAHVEVLGTRDAALRSLGALVGILDGMGWEPTYAQDRAAVEAARALLSTENADG